ncbi:hypothetical protein CTI12_AA398800 [Artemisia annua]|uniref:Uncharacterized protein n=1 Tax=Artemisia annua TaxID=35608 RepID=A0A2U1MBB9_ARTAN|nr:hypothetical protein CTI12_AA398800 [Artemisia annua]
MTGFQSHVSKESERLSRIYIDFEEIYIDFEEICEVGYGREDLRTEAIKLAELHHPNFGAFYGVVLSGPGGSVATKNKKKLCFNLMSQPTEVEIAKKSRAEIKIANNHTLHGESGSQDSNEGSDANSENIGILASTYATC